MSSHPPSFPAFRLYKRTSAKGTEYLSGRWGNVRVTVLKSKTTTEDSTEVYDVLFAEAPQKASTKPPPEGANPAPYSTAGADPEAAKRDWQRPASPDTEIPF